MSLILDKTGQGMFHLEHPKLSWSYLSQKFPVNEMERFATKIGLKWQNPEAFQRAFFPILSINQSGFCGKINETIQARRVEDLFGKPLNWCLSSEFEVVASFVELYAIVLGNIREPELSSALKEMSAATKNTQEIELRLDAIGHLLSNHMFVDDELNFGQLSTRNRLLGEQKLLRLEIERSKRDILIASLREKIAKTNLVRNGGAVYARPLDWKWRDISAFAAIMYFLAQKSRPGSSPRGRFGHGGELPTFNRFLREFAEGLVENWETKTHLERMKPRPDHISQFDDETLLLGISA